MRNAVLAGMAALMLAVPAAHAADMPLKAPPTPAPVVDWTGIYLGLEGGGLFGNSRWSTTCFLSGGMCPNARYFVDASSPHTFNTAGFRGGVYVGVQRQFGNWVAGVESDIAWSNASQATAGIVGCAAFCGNVLPSAGNIDSSTVRLEGDGSIRGRLGFLWTPNLLVYATGGVAFQDVEQNVICSPTGPWCVTGRNQTNQTWLPGYTIGGGLEWRYTGNWFVRLEGRYSGYRTFNSSFFFGSVDQVNTSLRVDTTMGMVGISYKTP